ncbi:MAG: DNA polymerase III subunit chi [Proteobacteria bacterium]|nr:DNA polymerase III subunit chi [Pseudomonadota bacterium]MDA0992893.1 DNA polymerase III subunit chi [Pseudomonadota bacterium]
MSKVDFYVLPGSGEISRQQFACRLAEKAYRLDNSVHIHVADHESLQILDDLLWTFRDGSFVPHEVIDAVHSKAGTPVTIGCVESLLPGCDLLINLSHSIPKSASSFPRVAEVVTSDEESKAESRKRFVDYRDQGHSLDTHKL